MSWSRTPKNTCYDTYHKPPPHKDHYMRAENNPGDR